MCTRLGNVFSAAQELRWRPLSTPKLSAGTAFQSWRAFARESRNGPAWLAVPGGYALKIGRFSARKKNTRPAAATTPAPFFQPVTNYFEHPA